MSSHQVIAPGRAPKGRFKTVAAAFGAVATLIGLVSGGIAIMDYLNRDTGPAVFTEPLHTSGGMRGFLDFADEHDGEVVRLDTQCLYQEGQRTCVDEADPIGDAVVILDLNDDPACDAERNPWCPGSTYLFFFADNVADAQIDNGEFGAGSIVVRGYFTLSKRGNLGTLPPGSAAIYLTAVPAQEAK